MKTAVSIPDEVFARIERLARKSKKSRSQIYSAALQEYAARHAPDEITEAMNRVCDALAGEGQGPADPFVSAAATRILERTEW